MARSFSEPGFAARWPKVRAELVAGRLSRRQAARQLRIGTATLARMLAADPAVDPAVSGDSTA